MTSTPTPLNVAKLATQSGKLPGRGLVLLGLFGTSTAPKALIRLTSGRTQTIVPGDRISGREVSAIDETSVILSRKGTTYRLTLPGPPLNAEPSPKAD